nr:proline-rich protein 36-like [Aegilops tauschii subsp. strangulata]
MAARSGASSLSASPSSPPPLRRRPSVRARAPHGASLRSAASIHALLASAPLRVPLPAHHAAFGFACAWLPGSLWLRVPRRPAGLPLPLPARLLRSLAPRPAPAGVPLPPPVQVLSDAPAGSAPLAWTPPGRRGLAPPSRPRSRRLAAAADRVRAGLAAAVSCCRPARRIRFCPRPDSRRSLAPPLHAAGLPGPAGPPPRLYAPSLGRLPIATRHCLPRPAPAAPAQCPAFVRAGFHATRPAGFPITRPNGSSRQPGDPDACRLRPPARRPGRLTAPCVPGLRRPAGAYLRPRPCSRAALGRPLACRSPRLLS